jgi:hypothetical protein
MSEQQEKAVGIIDVAGLPVITGDCKPGDRLYTAPPSVEALTKANAVLDALCEDRINEIASLRTTNAAQAERIAELEAAYDQAGRTIQTQGRELSISESRLHDVAVHCANVELELSILQSSSPAEPRKYFYYSPDVGFNIVDSLEEAKKFANNEISEYRDQADQEWPAEVDEICIGYLIAETVEVETVPGGCDYVLEAIASTAKPEPLSAAQGVPEGMAGKFYLQNSQGTVGNEMMWWGLDGRGYTTNLNKAHLFTEDEALTQQRCRATDIPWPAEYVRSHAHPSVTNGALWDAAPEQAESKEGKE